MPGEERTVAVLTQKGTVPQAALVDLIKLLRAFGR